MPVTTDIAATYRRPGRVMRRLLAMGQREDRALAILMFACAVVFVAQMPRLARDAHLTDGDLNMMLGGALLGWLIIAPLMFYGLAALSHVVARVIGGKGSWFGARLALFWALLASTPVLLLHGLVAGFIGPGPALDVVGILWLVVFGWFWISGLRQSERP
ncbi:MAG: YIP1 family protein, partial [Pseudomonadota bacterium]